MICKADHRLLTAALASVFAALALGGPLAAAPGDDAIAEAVAAIDRGDGVAAELAGKRALEQGARRDEVAALIGEGELLQGDLDDATQWLTQGTFSEATRGRGLHALARLALQRDNYTAASEIFNTLLAEGRATSLLWVDIGRMRYRTGEHMLALEAARQAVQLDPDEPRALEFRAQLLRDSGGLRQALPIFERALEIAPGDTGLMQQYAATLGDAGQHAQMLAVVRDMLEADGSALGAFYLQAILAARVGQDDLARRLWWRTDGEYDETAAGLLIAGVLEYRSGNPAVAVEQFNKLQRLQPYSDTALLLYARALLANGEGNVAIELLEPQAQRPDASAYLLVLIARAYEQQGDRESAGRYLDRVAGLGGAAVAPMPAFLPHDPFGRVANPDNPILQLRQLLAAGQQAEARALVGGLLQRFPGSVDLLTLAGDMELLGGNGGAALEYYRQAAQVRRDWPLVQRMVSAFVASGSLPQARNLLAEHLRQNPREQAAAAMLGRMQRDAGNPARATVLLRHAASLGSGPDDPALLADLAQLEAQLGHGEEALDRAQAAHAFQRGNRRVAAVLGRVLAMQGGENAGSRALLAKASGRGL